MDDLVAEFEHIIEEAPVDFLGTGCDSRFAAKCEREWYQLCFEFKKKLAILVAQKAEKRSSLIDISPVIGEKMINWNDYKSACDIHKMESVTGSDGILAKAEAEIDSYFADFSRKMDSALGQKKDSMLSLGMKKLGSSLTGDERAQQSKHYGVRGVLGNLASKSGEWLRPRTSMEKQYNMAAEWLIEKNLGDLLQEGSIPDWIEELKTRIKHSLETAMQSLFQRMQGAPQASPVKQTGKAATLTHLAAQYGGVDNIPPEEFNRVFPPLKSGGQSAAAKKAVSATAPVGSIVTGPRQVR